MCTYFQGFRQSFEDRRYTGVAFYVFSGLHKILHVQEKVDKVDTQSNLCCSVINLRKYICILVKHSKRRIYSVQVLSCSKNGPRLSLLLYIYILREILIGNFFNGNITGNNFSLLIDQTVEILYILISIYKLIWTFIPHIYKCVCKIMPNFKIHSWVLYKF